MKCKLNFLLVLPLFSCLSVSAQGVKISNNPGSPDASAQLEVESTNKGLLIPRVNLQSANDAVTISSPATSLMVYNTGGTLQPAGYYFNSGTNVSPVWTLLFTNPANAELDMANQKIVNLAPPVNGTDAVNKDYVDNSVSGSGGITYNPPTMTSTPSGVGLYYIAGLEYCRNLTEGGHTDWRMPTEEELHYIMQTDAVPLPSLSGSTYYWLNDNSTYSSSSNGSAKFKFCLYYNSVYSDSYLRQYTTGSSVPQVFCVR